VTKKAGLYDPTSKSLEIALIDFDNDGWMDLFVANDTVANFLFMNRGGKRFEEVGFTAGVGFGEGGKARSGMGVDSADLNQDGWMDLFVTNLNHEFDGIYQNRHDETFDDIAASSGIANATKLVSGWGAKFFDYDNDGSLDLIVANGHPDDLIEKIYDNVTYREPLLLFHNVGGGLKNVSHESGPTFTRSISARGLALGDFNNDGAVDVLISCNNESPVLLQNNIGRQNHWLGLKLVGKKANIDAIGAVVTYQSGDLKHSRMKVGGGSYLSSHDPRLVLGIGPRTKIDWVEIKWPQPSGLVQRISDLPIDRYLTIHEGQAT
jgi:enediyne biosynthesis protein E4